MSNARFVGPDVRAETIAVAVAEPDGEVRSLCVIPNRLASIRNLVKQLGSVEQWRVCYEAGQTGHVVYWELTSLCVKCEVVAPTLVPVKAGDRVKTDQRDALKLARGCRAGDLTAVWVPKAAHEALRDLVRVSIRTASGPGAVGLRKWAMPISGASSSKRRGNIATDRPWAARFGSARPPSEAK